MKGAQQILQALRAVGLGALVYLERKRPLRRRARSQPPRTARNLAVAAGAALVVRLVEDPLARALAEATHRRKLGLLHVVDLPPVLKAAAGFLALDYTLYHWHRFTHFVPLLWRFHAVHHRDRDLDASTGVRFHFGELLLSVPYRLMQVAVLGVSPQVLACWKQVLFASVLFHHSNVRLPRPLERRLAWLLVTPRMHGIHHSRRAVHRDSNWSSLLSWWDLLHGSFRLDVPQSKIVIGLPRHRLLSGRLRGE